MVLPDSRRVHRVPRYLGIRPEETDSFRLRDCHLLWCAFPGASAINPFCNSPMEPELHPVEPRNPAHATLPGLTHARFRLFPVRSPLLRESHLLSLPEDTKMFQFSSFASKAYVFSFRCSDITRNGFPHSDIPGSKLV